MRNCNEKKEVRVKMKRSKRKIKENKDDIEEGREGKRKNKKRRENWASYYRQKSRWQYI